MERMTKLNNRRRWLERLEASEWQYALVGKGRLEV
jgi:hypothetical protein